jgi:HlyD family secretion protein
MTHSITSQFTDDQRKTPGLLAKKQNHKKPIKLLVVVLAVIGSVGYLMQQNQPQAAANILQVSGRIDGYETEIGVKRSGRIELVTVREGEAVKKRAKASSA